MTILYEDHKELIRKTIGEELPKLNKRPPWDDIKEDAIALATRITEVYFTLRNNHYNNINRLFLMNGLEEGLGYLLHTNPLAFPSLFENKVCAKCYELAQEKEGENND